MRKIYLDNAAATPTDPLVLKAMAQAAKLYGNPSSFNDAGRAARTELEKARKTVANFLGARSDEIVFTASGSEANNLALLGTLRSFKNGFVLTTPIEHQSVLETLKKLPLKNKYIPVVKEGSVDLKALEKMLANGCRLVSVMYANNEIGTIEPVKAIAKVIKNFNQRTGSKVLFHVDACQAAGYLDMNVQRLGADLLTFNGSKVYGPHGTGVLYVRRSTPVQSLVLGGGQEHGLRAGTENVSAAVGLAKAITLIKPSEAKRIAALRDYAMGKIKKELPEAILNGPEGDKRLGNNINICVPGLTSEVLLLELDKYGIYAGSGSACTAHSVEPSHVLKAIGVPAKYINGALRFSLGRDTTKADLDYLVKTLKKITAELRKRYKS
ncbi:MAG TPA: cysteine desulfurase family protein [Candidatus Paceibacterota bacterium]|nr:cysteine desulfurase family protein [Candidatus Paceibacterota bacterium]